VLWTQPEPYSPKYIIYKTDKKLAGQTTASSEVEEEGVLVREGEAAGTLGDLLLLQKKKKKTCLTVSSRRALPR
jgi:hypothetical protein